MRWFSIGAYYDDNANLDHHALTEQGGVRVYLRLPARDNLTPVLHKIPAQNRFAASIAASKTLYSFSLDLT